MVAAGSHAADEQPILFAEVRGARDCGAGSPARQGGIADAIRGKRLAGAALDVYHPEPPREDFPLLGLDNVLLTPHLAARTYTALENMSWVVRDVVEVLSGRPAKYAAP